MSEFSHFDVSGNAIMVDVSQKQLTARSATAEALIAMAPATLDLILSGGSKKGDVIGVARLAGIMASKRTAELIPLCHPLPLDKVDLEIVPDKDIPGIRVAATCKTTGKTGVEMEALTAATVASLTIYDMCKAVDRGMVIKNTRLLHKSGGKSGVYRADNE